jgi:predicted ATPase
METDTFIDCPKLGVEMIKSLNLENFQGMTEAHSIRFAPITLVFGPNSSGKSSLIRSLLLLKQSVDFGNSSYQELEFQGGAIDLASFENVINGHNLDKTLTVGISSDVHNTGLPPGRNLMRQIMAQLLDILDSVEFVSKSTYEGLESSTLVFHFKNEFLPIRIEVPESWQDNSPAVGLRIPQEFFQLSADSIQTLNGIYSSFMFSAERPDHFDDDDEFSAFLKRNELPESDDWISELRPVQFRGIFPVFPLRVADQDDDSYTLNRVATIWEALFRIARVSISRSLDLVRHVPPLREIPERLLVVDASSPSTQSKALDKKVSAWIERLTDGRYSLQNIEFKPTQVGFMGSLRARLLIENKTNTQVSFKDVGVGLSQVLPIVEVLLDNASRIHTSNRVERSVVIEQPELHLHPKMQAELMELFIETVTSENNRVQVIAETHSESMILRLQKRIREGSLDPSKVSILYAETSQDGFNTIRELALDKHGEFIEDWPLSFSDVRVKEIFE